MSASGAPAPRTAEGARHASIDLLRGAVMALMALDHVRDFFGDGARATQLSTTTPALFFTRWVTHFCAPVFVLLAGTSAALYGAHRSRAETARFLWTRGVWLVLLELTVIRFGWRFDTAMRAFILQVIWAIGMSMVVLAALVWLPRVAVALVGAALIVGHNALDRWTPAGPLVSLWDVLHVTGRIGPWHGIRVFVLYPLVPWIGVMALGFALGPWMLLEPAARQRRLFALGVAITSAFVIVRGLNHYGDPEPWTHQRSTGFTILSFLNCEKYPPSLSYLLMTLGPALVALAWLDRKPRPALAPLLAYGRVPLFFYAVHLYLIHSVSSVIVLLRHGTRAFTTDHGWNAGLPLWAVYLVWLMVLAVLLPACVGFGRQKAAHRGVWWWSYL